MSPPAPTTTMIEISQPTCEERLAEHARFIECRAAVYHRLWGVDMDDLRQEASVAVFEAHQTFDPSRGVKFLTWAGWCIRKRLRDYVLHNCRQVRTPRFQFERGRHATDEMSLDIVCCPATGETYQTRVVANPDGGKDPWLKDQVVGAVDSLRDKDRDIVRWFYFDGLTTPQIAKLLGCSHQAINHRLKTSRRSLSYRLAHLRA